MPNSEEVITTRKMHECMALILELRKYYESIMLNEDIDEDILNSLTTEYNELVSSEHVSFSAVQGLLDKLKSEREFIKNLYNCRLMLSQLEIQAAKMQDPFARNGLGAFIDTYSHAIETLNLNRTLSQIKLSRSSENLARISSAISDDRSATSVPLAPQDISELLIILSYRVKETEFQLEKQQVYLEFQISDGKVKNIEAGERLCAAFKKLYKDVKYNIGNGREEKITALAEGRKILTQIDECEREKLTKIPVTVEPQNVFLSCFTGSNRKTNVTVTHTRSLSLINAEENELHAKLALQLVLARLEVQYNELERPDRSNLNTPSPM